jgi:hypothetical protein
MKLVSMIIDVASYLHCIYVVCHVVFTLCPYCNDIALILWLYWICIFSCKWYNVVTIWLQTLLLYWFYIVFMLSIFCIYVVLIFFQHRICIACALLNIGDAMLQQHSYKLYIQYWLNVVFLLFMLLYLCYNHTFPTLYLYCLCVVEGRWCNVTTTQLQIGYSIVNQYCIHVYYDVVNVL